MFQGKNSGGFLGFSGWGASVAMMIRVEALAG
jgi:hypothetical protein